MRDTSQDKQKRIEIVDVLRGFALITVWLVHVSGEFAGWSSLFIDTTTKAALPTAGVDRAVDFFVYLFLANKSRLLFAFLFGVGFYFQLNNANRSGARIIPKFLKRLSFLFIIGLLHACLLWSGDLFRVYAICGGFLLLVHKWRPRKLLTAAIILSIIVPAVSAIIRNYYPGAASSPEIGAMIYQGYKGHSYFDLIKANLLRDKVVYLDINVIGSFLVVMIGNFIFGYLAAQSDFFRKLSGNPVLLKRCLYLSLFAGFFFSPSFVRVLVLLLHYNGPLPLVVLNLLAVPAAFSYQAMALFLLSLVIVLYNNPRYKKMMQLLIPAGQMTLTNYIMQSVFGVFIFFGVGLGLFGRFGASVAFAIGIVVMAFQIWYSIWWLRYFTMGPLEYLWRSITLNKWQSMRRRPAPIYTGQL